MMETVAQGLLDSVNWGSAMRLYTGAGLSILDLFTDLFMIYTYTTTGQKEAATSMALAVGTSLLLQLLTVYIQTKKQPVSAQVKEVLILFSGCKPGVEAYRVASKMEMEPGATLSAELVLVMTRSIEMVAESIPG
jgi:hypothetical protein